jgi:3'(2'), 5'-bisphosphate nucleotidase
MVSAVPSPPDRLTPSVADAELAARLAGAAGELLLEIRPRLDRGDDPATVRADGDRRSHELVTGELARLRPADAVLSEEGADDGARRRAERVWIVDPLDGTREFGEPPNPDWAVHVALWERGDLVVGAVALPARGIVFSSEEPAPLPAAAPVVRLAVSRTRPPALTDQLRDALGAELVPMGSAGAKAMAILRGEVDVYAHAGGQYEWDSAAPVAVASRHGLHTSRLDGSPLRYNQPDPWLPDLLICRPELAEQVIAIAGGQL